MQNWRLSRIEEELENLNFQNLPPGPSGRPEVRDGSEISLRASNTQLNTAQPPVHANQQNGQGQENSVQSVQAGKEPLYSSTAVVQKQNMEGSEAKSDMAAKTISEKYDSLGRVKVKPTDFIENNMVPSEQNGYGGESLNDGYGLSVSTEDMLKRQESLTEDDIGQVESFFKSLKTEVFPCQGLANLYFGKKENQSQTVDTWELIHSGIPLFIMDTGETHRQRKLYIVLAEKGTGFILWKDVINHLTNYKTPHPNFHTLYMSNDHTKIAGLSFDDPFAATDFRRILQELTSDPDDDILTLSYKKSKKRRELEKKLRKQRKNYKAPKKTDISNPCCFEHVTKVEKTDRDRIYTLSSLVPEKDDYSRRKSTGQCTALAH